MYLKWIDELKVKFTEPLPGLTAQLKMAHSTREPVFNTSPQTKAYKQCGVLILIYPNLKNQPTLLLIERPTYNGHHSAQIALPGGKAELHDANLKETAYREFKEETGCIVSPLFIGKLTDIAIPVSKYLVSPYVAYLNFKPVFAPDKNEVEQILEFEIADLINQLTVKLTMVNPMDNLTFETPYYQVNNKIVWGATAMILSELKEMVV